MHAVGKAAVQLAVACTFNDYHPTCQPEVFLFNRLLQHVSFQKELGSLSVSNTVTS